MGTRLQTKTPPTQPLERPHNVFHTIADGINNVVGLVQKPIELLDTGIAKATNFVAKALPAFPAAALGTCALGWPHAHPLHPPFIPLPPFGPILFGNCVQVLINGRPAARCGDLGLSPTCCGLTPFYEVFTGSSNVFIGGSRAARVTDITLHCKLFPPPAGRAVSGLQKLITVYEEILSVAGIAGMAAQGLSAVGDAVASEQVEDPAMSQALALSATMQGVQLISDMIALVIGGLMGKDLAVAPGTPGMVLFFGSPNVLIGGIPMPASLEILKGLFKVKGLQRRRKKRKNNKSKVGGSSC